MRRRRYCQLVARYDEIGQPFNPIRRRELPSLRLAGGLEVGQDDIDRLVAETPGVAGVDSEIRVLPPSSEDDRLRREIARVIYSDPAMTSLARLAPPPIHIIVENGRVTLAGAGENELQKTVAGVRASAVGMIFGPVVNNLVVADPPAKKKA